MLGVYLQVSPNKLQEIEKQHNKDASHCKVEMLSLWLQGECTPSWKQLVEALYSMKMNALASTISGSNMGFEVIMCVNIATVI